MDLKCGSMQTMHGAEVTQSTGWKPVQQQLQHSENEMKCVRQLFVYNFAVNRVIATVVDLVTM